MFFTGILKKSCSKPRCQKGSCEFPFQIRLKTRFSFHVRFASNALSGGAGLVNEIPVLIEFIEGPNQPASNHYGRNTFETNVTADEVEALRRDGQTRRFQEAGLFYKNGSVVYTQLYTPLAVRKWSRSRQI